MQDVAGHQIENPIIPSKILPGFMDSISQLSPESLDPIANDFSRLTSQLDSDRRQTILPEIDSILNKYPSRGIRMLLNIFAPTPEVYLHNIRNVKEAAKKMYPTEEMEAWYQRMYGLGVDMFGADWVTAQAKEK